MKKVFCIILISLCTIIMMTGCNKKVSSESVKTHKNEDSQERIKIMENVYVDYINDIYLDSSKYVGKTIELEGMFTKLKTEDNKNHLYVYRLTDIVEHSHDNDNSEHEHEENKEVEAMSGLEFDYDGDLPKENDWIKVVGKLEEQGGNLVINADSVKIMKNRGMEKVKKFY
ncbi:TIGR03943 family putative permease subunit [Terrisporobacter vanillatitrophus]|uniref:TIGR03943 family putative permease subunit n=1 Tax=Terrisporobacter vanillatitrophus TaxID=3058402 RepID=UPI0033698CBC